MTNEPTTRPTAEELQIQVLELQIRHLEHTTRDHEARLRIVEDVATKFNFMLYLTMGGGLIGLFNLFSIGGVIFLISK